MGRNIRPTTPTPALTPTPKPQSVKKANKELDKLQEQVKQLIEDKQQQQKNSPQPKPDPMGSLLKLIAVMRKCLNGRGNNPMMQQQLAQVAKMMPQMPKQLAPQMQRVLTAGNDVTQDQQQQLRQGQPLNTNQQTLNSQRPTAGVISANTQNPSLAPRPTPGRAKDVDERNDTQASHHAGVSAIGKGADVAASAAAIKPPLAIEPSK
ncbi:MAG: hypothetical protein P1U63_05580 [Coxiellaceae bacterium]|nr:hypothetical protein [Coxiellaceae bacterium]